MNDPLLDKLKTLQAQVAIESVKSPRDKTEFEYGRACGLYEGVQRAIAAYESLLRDDEEHGKAL